MALPEDEHREQERRRIELERRDDVARAGGIWYAWWWVWFVILIAFVWFIGWGWAGYGGWWSGQPRTAVVIQTPAGSGFAPAPSCAVLVKTQLQNARQSWSAS